MRPRFDTARQFRRLHHYSCPADLLSRPPRESARHGSTSPGPPRKSGIGTAELNGFALGCIEKLAFPGKTGPGAGHSVEDTIASVMLEKLPSYTTLKASLKAATEANAEDLVWSSTLPASITRLTGQVESMQQTIAAHLVQTGEEIGLPAALMAKLAELTRAILARYAA